MVHLLYCNESFNSNTSVCIFCIVHQGGSDSLGLCILVKDWISRLEKLHRTKIPMYALTIDHKLRKESTREAHTVRNWTRSMGYITISHCIQWENGDSKSGISNMQVKARDARFSSLKRLCLERNVSYLFLGHHKNDQVFVAISVGTACDKIITEYSTLAG